MPLHRPEPVLRHRAAPVTQQDPPRQAAARLRDGEPLVVTDHYATGAEILAQLRDLIGPRPDPGAPYQFRRAAARVHRDAALRLLAPVNKHALALGGGRPIGFLAELYPELSGTFFLPFMQIQEMHAAWYHYVEGVHMAVLGRRLHPFYGTYAPTRVPHLELFATWLSQHTRGLGETRGQAIDLGTGCGVLALMLSRAGFKGVLATDNNPNAIESLKRELSRVTPSPDIRLACGDLFAGHTEKADLIVCNPPWIQGPVEGLLDAALHFEPGLFERLFDQAVARLKPEGRLVLLFSNVLQLMQPEVPHPILAELERGRLTLVDKLHRKVAGERTASGARRKTREQVEVWELALTSARR